MLATAVVLLELFTSEGCSSCPVADAAVARLAALEPDVVALEEHVDYWDDLGWRDPFSAATFTLRQRRYAEALAPHRVYTPELVVDGAAEVVGSDERAARAALAHARETPKLAVTLERAGAGGALVFHAGVAGAPAGTELVVALIEDGLDVRVERGENAGRSLRHGAVVRALTVAGADGVARFPPGTRATRAVAFAQDGRTRRVLGAAVVSLVVK